MPLVATRGAIVLIWVYFWLWNRAGAARPNAISRSR